MAKFTPGPWEIEKRKTVPAYLVKSPLCTVAEIFTNSWMTESNARLIAAAPEMYELLRTAMPSQYSCAIDAEKWRQQRRALLARIDGEDDTSST